MSDRSRRSTAAGLAKPCERSLRAPNLACHVRRRPGGGNQVEPVLQPIGRRQDDAALLVTRGRRWGSRQADGDSGNRERQTENSSMHWPYLRTAPVGLSSLLPARVAGEPAATIDRWRVQFPAAPPLNAMVRIGLSTSRTAVLGNEGPRLRRSCGRRTGRCSRWPRLSRFRSRRRPSPGTLPDWATIAVSATAACRRCERPDHDGLTANSDQSAHVQLGGLIEFARSTRV